LSTITRLCPQNTESLKHHTASTDGNKADCAQILTFLHNEQYNVVGSSASNLKEVLLQTIFKPP
jgi:hypothetical protein